jgi:hypothetical protein
MGNGDVRTAPWGKNGSTVPVVLIEATGGEWYLQWGVHKKKVIVIEALL